MKRVLCLAAIFTFTSVGNVVAQIDVARLNEAYKAYDLSRNEGKGYSESADSGTLGWGEGAVIPSYAQMWEATEDVYWLTKIGEHFQRILQIIVFDQHGFRIGGPTFIKQGGLDLPADGIPQFTTHRIQEMVAGYRLVGGQHLVFTIQASLKMISW